MLLCWASYATVGGGRWDTASGPLSTVSGGSRNLASANSATVAGGASNVADGLLAAIGGGQENTASGLGATVPGGLGNSAIGDYAFAAGNRAKANHFGSVVITAAAGDSALSGGNFQMVLRADGGLYITDSAGMAPYDDTKLITTLGGAFLSGNGTVWTNASDKNLKENFAEVDSEQLLEKIAELPISRWKYKSESNEVTHIGPTAQDFHELFGLGSDSVSISTIDPSGIALAAIQQLHRTTAGLKKKIERIDELEAPLEQLAELVRRSLEK